MGRVASSSSPSTPTIRTCIPTRISRGWSRARPRTRRLGCSRTGRPRGTGRGARGSAFLGRLLATGASSGHVAFTGDLVLHRTVDASPWLTANAWLISATLLASGGRLSIRPMEATQLAACRHPSLAALPSRAGSNPARMGFRHALDCLGSSGGADAGDVRGGLRQPLVDGRPGARHGVRGDGPAWPNGCLDRRVPACCSWPSSSCRPAVRSSEPGLNPRCCPCRSAKPIL